MTGFAAALAAAGMQNDEEQQVTQFLTTGDPVLDHRLSGRYHDGGFAAGRIGIIAGPSSSGKTAIATNVMAKAQAAGGIAGFHDHEKTFALHLGKKIGLTDDPNHWVYIRPTTFEESIDAMMKKVLFARGMERKGGHFVPIKGAKCYYPMDIPFAWVFDSLKFMKPQQSAEKDAADFNMNDSTALSRVCGLHMDTLSTFAAETNTCIIFLNHLKMKFGCDPKYPVWQMPGGDATYFAASQILYLTASPIKNEKDVSKPLGQTIKCLVQKNKIVYPKQRCSWDFVFHTHGVFNSDGSGRFDVVSAIIDELKELNILESSGAYLNFKGAKYFKSVLAKKIDEDGLFDELKGMLPANV